MTRWVAEIADEGEVAFRIGRDGDAYVAEWLGLCELRSDRAGADVTFRAEPDADEAVIAKIRAGLADALLAHLRGETSLHASAVARDGRALAFLGRSGDGKSTLAAHLCQRGFALVADDVLRVTARDGELVATPKERDHWLTPASQDVLGLAAAHEGPKKVRVAARRSAEGAVRLAAMVALVWDDDVATPRLERLRGQRAIAAVVPSLVRFVIDDPVEHVRELDRIETLLRSAPLFELRRRRDFSTLREQADVSERLMKEMA